MISFISALLLFHGLLVRAEPPVTTYSITGDNRYDYSNSVSSSGYLGKEGHTENGDFYAAGTNGHSGIGSGSQGNVGHSLASTSYSGFSPSTHNTGYSSYATSNHDDFASQYPPSTHTSASFKGYSSTPSNGESVFDGYTAGIGHGASSINHYSSSGQSKAPSYAPFSDNAAGASSTTYSSEPIPDPSTFRGYSTVGGSLGYAESDQPISAEASYSSYAFAGNSDFPLAKHREPIFAGGKHISDAYPVPSEMRYLRGNQGSIYHTPSTMYLMSSGTSGLVPGVRTGPSSIYAPGKLTKYGKYPSEFSGHGNPNYLQRDQEADYLSSLYAKAPGAKVIILKDGRPSSHGGQSYPSTYLSKVMGSASHKGKQPGFMSYPGSSVGHAFMSNLRGSFGGSPYSEGHLPRGYRSSAAYAPGHSSIYPAYH